MNWGLKSPSFVRTRNTFLLLKILPPGTLRPFARTQIEHNLAQPSHRSRMNWFYALGGQQQGPVDDGQLDALAAAGTITPDTLVWREGMANWQPLRHARPVSSAALQAPPPPPPPVMGPSGAAQPLSANEAFCVECGNRFTKDNLIQY